MVETVSVPVESRAPTGTTTAVVFGTDPASLVDPGATSESLDVLVDERAVGHLAVTHHHPDHAGAVATYARRCDATVWARQGRTDGFAEATGVEPDRTFREGTTIPTGSGGVCVVETPGHAPEHVGFRSGGILACVDLAIAEGSVAVAAPDGDVRAYLTSLRRVLAMAPDRLVPGHGPALAGAAVHSSLRRLLAHRRDREERVRAAVQDGAETVESIRQRAYDAALEGVRDLADATVRAHLAKLAVEGHVRWNGERALPPD